MRGRKFLSLFLATVATKLGNSSISLTCFLVVTNRVTLFVVFTHMMRAMLSVQNKISHKSCIIIEANSQKTFCTIALYTKMAALSCENPEFVIFL